jgi:hypothetical protein
MNCIFQRYPTLQFFSPISNLVAIAWGSPFNARLDGFFSQARMVETAMDDIGREAASTLLARQQRNGRLYDVPQIGESGSSSTPGMHSTYRSMSHYPSTFQTTTCYTSTAPYFNQEKLMFAG